MSGSAPTGKPLRADYVAEDRMLAEKGGAAPATRSGHHIDMLPGQDRPATDDRHLTDSVVRSTLMALAPDKSGVSGKKPAAPLTDLLDDSLVGAAHGGEAKPLDAPATGARWQADTAPPAIAAGYATKAHQEDGEPGTPWLRIQDVVTRAAGKLRPGKDKA